MATHYHSTTSPSKQSLICRRKTRLRPDSCKKIKLLCSYGGAFLPRSFTGKLRYSGGETRIVSIHRDAGISRLRTKLAEFRSSPSLVLKYQLPDSVIDAPLVSVSTDEDFENMVDEHDKLEAEGNLGRLRLFLCEDPGYVETQVSDLCSSEFGHVTSRTGEFLSQKLSETKIQTLHQAGTGNFWYPLPDIQSAPCLNPAGGELGLVGNFRFPTISCSLSTRLTEPLVSGEGFRFANCDQSGRNRFQFQNQAQYSVQAVDAEHGLLKSRNSYIENVNRANILPWNHDPVSLAPVSCFDRSAKHFSLSKHDGFLPNAECRIENHSTISCDIQNPQNNAYDFGHCRIVGFDGRNCAGKCYPGLKPRSNISKFAHNRLHFTHLGRPWFNTPEYMREQRMAKIVEPIIRRTQPLSNHESGRRMLRSRASHQRNGRTLVDHHAQLEREIGTCLDRKTNLQRDCLNYCRVPLDLSAHHGPPHHITNQSQLPSNFFDNQIPWFGDMTVRDDCSCHSERTHCKISSQAMRNNPFITPHDPVRVNLKFHDLNLEPNAKEMAKRNFVGLGYNAMFPGYNPKIQQNDMCKNSEGLQDKAVQVSSNDFVKLEASSRNFKSLMGLSVDNRSLSSNSTDASQIYDQSFALEQMNIGPTKSGMVVEKASGLGTDNRHNEQSSLRLSEWPGRSHAQVCSESKKNYTCREENKQTILCGLDAEEKDIVQGCGDGSKIDSGVNGDHKKSLTCIAMPELQTIKNSDLEEIRELGSGTYGTVFYGKWKGCDVVIKRIKSSCFSNGEVEDRLINDFWKEAHILAQLHHPNVVAFYGVVRDEQVANLATVTEYMVNGSLKQVLQRKDRTIDRRKRLIISMDVAFGMEYLHEKNIVHFDLKSANLLVNMKDPQRPVCKIGDLGLSKVKQKTLVSGGVRGTLPWIAPELLSGKSRMVSEKVDVYSFGIVLWELLTGEEPYAGMRSHEIIEGIINGSLRPEIPCWCDPIWRSLMERCWSSDPESRPAFSEIAKELRAMSVSMNIK